MSLFEGLDPDILLDASDAIGQGFVAGASDVITQLAKDYCVSPRVLSAAIVRAHLLGAATAIVGALERPQPIADPQHVVMEAMALLANTVSDLRRAR